jgi:ketoreductase RED2
MQMGEISGEFRDRVVLVTGSSSGIGEAIARRLSALGASVVINSASSAEAGQRIAAELGGNAFYVQADIADPAAPKILLDATLARFGRLDILVNNAGWTTVVPHADLDALSDEIFAKTFDVNVTGTWRLTKAALPHLAKSEDGNVLTITSIAGVRPVDGQGGAEPDDAAAGQVLRAGAGQCRRPGPGRNAVDRGLGRAA